MYTVDSNGVRQYMLPSGEQITDSNAPSSVETQSFGFDELLYAAQDIIGFINPILDAIRGVINDATMLGYEDSDILRLEDLISNLGILLQILTLNAYYKSALLDRLYNWIDETVNERDELNDDFKNRLKINMKKWILDQQDFGDVSVLEVIVGMGSHSKSPIIKAMQNMINDMQDERDLIVYKRGIALMELKRKAERSMGIKYRILPFNFLKLLMQLDRRGLPTGYFISRINKGLYLQDRSNERDRLLFGDKHYDGLEKQLKELKDSSGNPIYVDATGKPIEKLQFDEFGFPIIPENDEAERLVKEYLIKFEQWKCKHSNRQFTELYYTTRVRMLSIAALRELNRIDSKIDGIIEAITVNGVTRMDLLTSDLQDEYLMYKEEKDFLGSIYYPDGTMKDPDSDEYAIAESIRNFRAVTRGKIAYKTNQDAYDESYNNAKNKKDFENRFSRWVINPELYNYISKHSTNNRSQTDPDVIELAKLQYDRSILVRQFEGRKIGEIKWGELYDSNRKRIKKESFWKTLTELDEQISYLLTKLNRTYGKNSALFTALMDRFEIPVDRAGNWATSLSVYNKIVEEIYNSIYNDPNMNKQQKDTEFFKQMNLIQYYSSSQGTSNNPSSIFTIFLPREEYTTNQTTGEQYKDYVKVPDSVFLTIDFDNSDSDWVNKDYDPTGERELPDEYLYKDERYEKYVKDNPELVELLDELKKTMQESWDKIPFLGTYDDRLSQIGARTGQILGRKMFRRFFSNFAEFLRREWEVVETDTEFAPDGDVQYRPDGSRIRNIPVRFVKMLERPEYISSDVVGSVIKFLDMAINYNVKAKNASLFTQIMNLLRNTDRGVESKLYDVMKGMINRLIYEDNSGLDNYNDKESKWKHADWIRKVLLVGGSKAWIKRIGKARISHQIGTLAFNISSGIVSFLDPLISLIVDSATGRYINWKNDLQAIRFLFGNLFLSLFSLGKVKSYGKLGAAMQKFQLSKSNREIFSDTDKGQVFRFLSDGLKMKIFSWGDYTMNSISLMATMDNYRAYHYMGHIKFLPKTLFIQEYMKDYKCDVKQATSAYNSAKSMWNSCEVNRHTGEFVAKDNVYGKAIDDTTWTAIRKQVRSRSSIYNGIVSNNERTMMQNHPFFSWLTSLRNFMIVGINDRFKNQRDFLVTTFDKNGNPSITDIDNTKTITPEEAKHTLLYYKGGLNFDTRSVEDGIYTCIGNWLRHFLPYFRFMMKAFASPFASKFYNKTRSYEFEDYLASNNLNRNSIYSAQRVFFEVLVAATLWFLYPITKKLADDDEDDYLLQFLNLINLRVAIERLTWFSPNTFMDLIQSPTALYSDWKRRLQIVDLLTESIGISDYVPSDLVKNGNFVGMARWKYHILSVLSGFGSHNWYTNMPTELGGGGAKAIRKKAGWYTRLIPGVIKSTIFNEITKEEKKSKSRRSRRNSGRRKHRRNRG